MLPENTVPNATPLIIVIGDSASGKSSFINDVLTHNGSNSARQPDLPPLGHDLETKTVTYIEYHTTIKKIRVILLDTPPLDATVWEELNTKYLGAETRRPSSNPHQRTFVVYLYAITRNRIGREMRTYMNILDDSGIDIVLVTTFWDRLKEQDVGTARETDLKSRFNIFHKAGPHLGRDGSPLKRPLPKFLDPYNFISNLLISPSISPSKARSNAVRHHSAGSIELPADEATVPPTIASLAQTGKPEHRDLIGKREGTLIIVMGDSASGKSSFIKDVLGPAHREYPPDPASHGSPLETITENYELYNTTMNDLCVTLLDTPPFDGALWSEIRTKYFETGDLVIFLYDITKNRLGKEMQTHLSRMSEEAGCSSVVLVTTFWDSVFSDEEEYAVKREEQLKTRFSMFQTCRRLGRDADHQSRPGLVHPTSIISELLAAAKPEPSQPTPASALGASTQVTVDHVALASASSTSASVSHATPSPVAVTRNSNNVSAAGPVVNNTEAISVGTSPDAAQKGPFKKMIKRIVNYLCPCL